ncbi:MAG: CpaF family protein [Chloroflexi bacterium]|nr:CpaF family protein [Chloroflexota bacterium]
MSLLRRIGGEGNAPQPTSTPAGGGASHDEGFRRPSLSTPKETGSELVQELKLAVQNRLIQENPTLNLNDVALVRKTIEDLFNTILDERGQVLPRADRIKMLDTINSDILGFGPLEELLRNDDIQEIMVNGPKKVYIEHKRHGMIKSEVVFRDDEAVRRVIDRIISPLGRRCDESQPMVDARLPDGSRVNAIIPPVALSGSTITIRKFSKTPLKVSDLVRFGSFTEEIAGFLQSCVAGRLNIVVSGGTGSGKTTLLNVLSSFISEYERIITVEDAAELQLGQDHVITLEARPPNVEGKGAITIRDLVKNTLRMRPDRVVIGECRGGEALDMLQAMNTGHDGSLTTGHANTPRDMLSRLETMVLMAGMDLPVRAIREQITGAVDLIIQQSRLRDHSRKVTAITEVVGIEGETIHIEDIFRFEQEGYDEKGKIIGQLRPTGYIPKFLPRLEHENQHVDMKLFERDLNLPVGEVVTH